MYDDKYFSKHEGVMAFGCGCNKGKQAPGVSAATRRATVYQVMVNGSVESEHNTLPEARTQATQVAGRVKVTSKIVA